MLIFLNFIYTEIFLELRPVFVFFLSFYKHCFDFFQQKIAHQSRRLIQLSLIDKVSTKILQIDVLCRPKVKVNDQRTVFFLGGISDNFFFDILLIKFSLFSFRLNIL